MSDKHTAYRGDSFHTLNEGDVSQTNYGVDPATGQPVQHYQQNPQGYGAGQYEQPINGQVATPQNYQEQVPDAYYNPAQAVDPAQNGYQANYGQTADGQPAQYAAEQPAQYTDGQPAQYADVQPAQYTDVQPAQYTDGQPAQYGYDQSVDQSQQGFGQQYVQPQDPYAQQGGFVEENPYLAAHQNATPPYEPAAHTYNNQYEPQQYQDPNAQYQEQQYYQQPDGTQVPVAYNNGAHDQMAAQQQQYAGAAVGGAETFGYDQQQAYTDYNGQPIQPQPQGMQQLNNPYEPVPIHAPQDASLADEMQSSGRKSFLVGTMILGSVIIGGGVAFAYKMTGSTTGDGAPVIVSDTGASKVAPDNPGGREFQNKNKKIFARLGDAGAVADIGVKPSGDPEVVPTLRGEIRDMNVADTGSARKLSNDLGGTRKVRTYRIDRNGSRLDDPKVVSAGLGKVKDIAGVAVVSEESARSVKTIRVGSAVEETRIASVEKATPTVGDGSYVVQISARRSQQDALAAFSGLKQKYGDVLTGYRPLIQKKDLGEKGVFYRLRVGPMASKETASSVCSQLKSKGLSSCFVSTR